MDVLKIIILAAVSYLIGNINVALLISKILKRDVRKLGSGNAGTMNMVRNFGVKIGALTLVLDVLKGALPCLLGWLFIGEFLSFEGSKMGAYIGGVSVITGNVFPALLKFKGGKGIASTIGVGFVLQPVVTSIAFASALTVLFITTFGSVSSFVAISPILIAEAFKLSADMSAEGIAGSIMIFCLFILICFAHRKNIVRLFKGTESRTVVFKKKKDKKSKINLTENHHS